MIRQSVQHESDARLEAKGGRSGRDGEASYTEFFRLNFTRTVRLAHLLTGSDAVAEDLAQVAFARIHSRFDDINNPAGYLHVVTVNVCRSWHKRNFRDTSAMERLGDPYGSGPVGPEHLLDLIDTLPYRQRAVLVLRYWLGLSEAELARALECRPGTVRSLHFRALATLRKELP